MEEEKGRDLIEAHFIEHIPCFTAMGERNVSSSIVGSIVQAANRKLRKSSNRKTILSSGGTPDNLSLDSSTVRRIDP